MTFFDDESELLLDDDELLFDVAIRPDDPLVRVRGNSTPATRARAAFLNTKKLGSVWTEGDCLYRMGARGVTVFALAVFDSDRRFYGHSK